MRLTELNLAREVMTSKWSNIRTESLLALLSTNVIVPSMMQHWLAAVRQQCMCNDYSVKSLQRAKYLRKVGTTKYSIVTNLNYESSSWLRCRLLKLCASNLFSFLYGFRKKLNKIGAMISRRNGEGVWKWQWQADACWVWHFFLGWGIFVSNHVFLCWTRLSFVSNKCDYTCYWSTQIKCVDVYPFHRNLYVFNTWLLYIFYALQWIEWSQVMPCLLLSTKSSPK